MLSFWPVSGFLRGVRAYPQGIRWLRQHPRYGFYLLLPMIMGVFFLVGGLSLFATYDESLLQWLSLSRTAADPWWWGILYYASKALLYVACIVLTILMSFLLMNIIASPIYEVISQAVERDFTGREPQDVGWRGLGKVMVSEAYKVIFILLLSVMLLLIPGVNLVSTLLTAFLVGWDFFDYPLVRRGWSFSERLRFVMKDGWAVFGFGLWLVIPFAQIVMLPLAVVGGTLLNLEALERERLLTLSKGEHNVTVK